MTWAPTATDLFRGVRAPASLKPFRHADLFAADCGLFRGVRAPASLKHVVRGHHDPVLRLFRGVRAPASLKRHAICTVQVET